MGLSALWEHTDYMIITILLALSAGFSGIYVVPLYTVLQTKSPQGFRSRTIAANNIMNALFMVAASVGAMLLIKVLPDVAALLAVVGLCNLIVAVLFKERGDA